MISGVSIYVGPFSFHWSVEEGFQTVRTGGSCRVWGFGILVAKWPR